MKERESALWVMIGGLVLALALMYSGLASAKAELRDVESAQSLSCQRPVFVSSDSGPGWKSSTYRCKDGSLMIREFYEVDQP